MNQMQEVFTIVSIDRETGVKLVEKTSNPCSMMKIVEENRYLFPYVVVYGDMHDDFVMKFVKGYQVL